MTQISVLIHVKLKVKWTFFYTQLAPCPDKLNGSKILFIHKLFISEECTPF